jgi:signal transduction histidine kinase
VTEGHFDEPEDLPYSRPDEIGELSKSFGIMSRRLAELDRLRAEFLGVASHELKTPINVIRGYTELIEEELAGELTPHQREIMQRIEEQTRVLTRQVSRLMDISRLETGSFMVEPESVLLSDLILGVQRTFEVVAIEKGIRFTTKLEPDAPERVVVDVDLIRDEVINNLVSNALKFTPTGGQVTVRAYGDDDTVIIDVSDTGPGIPPEHRSHVFEKYYQVERSRSMGSGLGLAIAKELVEVHGGTIRLVESKQGATFRVTLPVGGERITEEARLATAGRPSVV